MYSRCCMSVVILFASLAGLAYADVARDTGAIADRYLDAMKHKDYAFLSRTSCRAAAIRSPSLSPGTFARRWKPPLALPCWTASNAASTASIPARPVESIMATASAAAAKVILNNNFSLTLDTHFWAGLIRHWRPPTSRRSAAAVQRQHLAGLPVARGIQPLLAIRSRSVRGFWPLEKAFTDPLHLLEVLPNEAPACGSG